MIWTAPENKEIADRLLQAPCDKKEVLEEQFAEYEKFISGITQVYKELEKSLEKPIGGILVKINADQDQDTVLELATSMIINPVPLSS